MPHPPRKGRWSKRSEDEDVTGLTIEAYEADFNAQVEHYKRVGIKPWEWQPKFVTARDLKYLELKKAQRESLAKVTPPDDWGL